MYIKYTYCRNFSSAETREVDWEALAEMLTIFAAFPSKEASVAREAFVGGVRADETKGRADGNIVTRTVATLDFDAPKGSLDEIEFQLDLLMPCAFVAYSTFRHTPETPRIRLCVPLSRPVNEHDHRIVVNEIVRLVDIGPVDNCSFVMSQLMFLPSHKQGVEPWSMRRDGAAWDCGERSEAAVTDQDDPGGLEAIVAAEPKGMSDAEVDALLENYSADDREYDEWVRVGMALYHEFRGSDEGYSRWLAWSEKSPKHNPRQMVAKWRSFGGSTRPVTMASIIMLAGGRRSAVEIALTGPTFVALEAEARALRSVNDYMALRDKMVGLPDTQLRADMRSVIVNAAFDAFGKGAGMTKTAIGKVFKPMRAKGLVGEGDASAPFDGPSWLEDWIYCEADCTFEMISTRHSIKREAFRAKFDRMPEVAMSEFKDAAYFALTVCNLPTVATKMFWPGAERIFTHDTGLRHLNTYEKSGAEPCDEIDDEARAIMGRFMTHVENTVASEREQRILIDFMAFVYQHPGKRVQWALLLKGIEGNGKSYFFRVMQAVLGKQASVVSTTAIDSSFTGWAEGSVLVCIEEIRISGTNKYAILDKLKPIISNSTIAVVHKGKDEKHIPNFTSYMMFTNHADAIPISENDRRYCVIFTRQTRKEDLFAQHGGEEATAAYFAQLFDDLTRRPDVFARMLSDRSISVDFSPSGRAPETSGLNMMRALNVSEDKRMVEDAIKDKECEVINEDLIDVTYLNDLMTIEPEGLPHNKSMSHILTDLGYSKTEPDRVKIKTDKKYHHFWFREGTMTSDEAIQKIRAFHAGNSSLSVPE